MSTFISDSDEWSRLSKLWDDSYLPDRFKTVNSIIRDDINRILQSANVYGVAQVFGIDLEWRSSQLSEYCSKIHTRVEEEVDDPFAYTLAKAADQAYGINPNELTVSPPGGGYPISLINLVSVISDIDKDLKKSFEEGVERIGNLTPSVDLQEAILDALMRKYKGVMRGTEVDQPDIELILHYYELLTPYDTDYLKLLLPECRTQGEIYDSELEAVMAVAADMRALTDRYNREAVVVISIIDVTTIVDGKTVHTKKYQVSSIGLGKNGDVIAQAIYECPLGLLQPNKILVHTHPYEEGRDNSNFSGDPAHLYFGENFWTDFDITEGKGDVSVPTLLGYDSIYLIAPDASIKKFEGIGQGSNQATTKQELDNIQPISTDGPKPKVIYLKDPVSGKPFPVYTKD